MSYAALRTLLAPWGELRPQPASDWQGPIPLPATLADFYAQVGPWGETYHAHVGPTGVSLDIGGNPVDIPPLHKLWQLQAGYRWNAVSGERLADWSEQWLVVADQGADPFILDVASGEVLFAFHGAGAWQPKRLAASLDSAFGGLATIANAMAELGDDAFDETDELRATARAAVASSLASYLGSAAQAAQFLDALEWYQA
ncbi:hypothetical protein [Xanthomonas bonasiae]|uniref:hypothetical protein n=1 Tax=Xanthomonas bonasiae TaxID=2810351 RepID=UPI00197E2981|nr:hypothetical protein [Xanthomonas bonasiae]MBN6112372.1 hypothetical protein [Xanthomonas bonasiae]